LRIVIPSARRASALVAVGALALTSAACGSSSSTSSAAGTTTSAAATSAAATAGAAPTSGAASAKPGGAVVIVLPPNIKKAGVLTVATDASYAPVESFAPNNKTIIGMDPDLGAALGNVLGIKVVFTNTGFDGIIPALQAGRYDMAMSAMTDTLARQKTVNFVDYFDAGTSFMIKTGGKPVTALADLCGLTVAVEKGTTQFDDATAQAKKCGSKPDTVLPFPAQNGANLALSSGRATVVMADSPVNAYAAKQSNGAFVISGTPYGTAPYGIAIPKTSTVLRDAMAAALTKIIADGTYTKVLTKWGVNDGAVTKATINGGTS
jgi:polar amino acid transport system substrate-binding protein